MAAPTRKQMLQSLAKCINQNPIVFNNFKLFSSHQGYKISSQYHKFSTDVGIISLEPLCPIGTPRRSGRSVPLSLTLFGRPNFGGDRMTFQRQSFTNVYCKKRRFVSQSCKPIDQTETPLKVKCWKCGKEAVLSAERFFCQCGVIQCPTDQITHFDLMQQEISFDLDAKELGVKFRDLQWLLHPDKFSSKSEVEQKLAQDQSSQLNKAYDVLLRPLSRAIYMLKLKGISIEEKDTLSDPEFLMDVITINEKIDEVQTDGDITKLEDKNNEVMDKCIVKISESFRKSEDEAAKNETIRLRYFTTIQERLAQLRRSRLG